MRTLAALSCLSIFAALSARATVVSWNLEPNTIAGITDPASRAFVSQESSIVATVDTVGWPSQTPLGLYYGDHAFGQTAPGIVGPAGQQGQEKGSLPNQFMQFDISSALAQGLTDGKIQLGSVQSSANDAFAIWNSSALGDSGVATDELDDSPSEMVFARIANLANGKFISSGSLSGAEMPVAFQSTLAPVPEISALFPIIGLIAAVAVTQVLRRRRIAQLRAASPTMR